MAVVAWVEVLPPHPIEESREVAIGQGFLPGMAIKIDVFTRWFAHKSDFGVFAQLIDEVLAGRKSAPPNDAEKFAFLVDFPRRNDVGDDGFVQIIVAAAVHAYVEDEFFDGIFIYKIKGYWPLKCWTRVASSRVPSLASICCICRAMRSEILSLYLLDTVPLRKDLDNLRHYFDLERLRLPDTADMTFRMQGSVENQRIAPLLLLPLVENAFKHGVYCIRENHLFKIEISVVGHVLRLKTLNRMPIGEAHPIRWAWGSKTCENGLT